MDFPVFPRKKYSGWQKPSAARHSAEIFVPEGHISHRKALPAQVVQVPRVRGQVKGQLVGIQGLPRLAVAAVYVPTTVFAVPQQRAGTGLWYTDTCFFFSSFSKKHSTRPSGFFGRPAVMQR